MADMTVAVRVSPHMWTQIQDVIQKKLYLNESEFVREAIREKLERLVE